MFSRLPVEIIRLVMTASTSSTSDYYSYQSRQKTLRALARVSRGLRQIAQEVLHEFVWIRSQLQLDRLIPRTDKFRLCRRLHLEGDTTTDRIERLLANFENLTHLSVNLSERERSARLSALRASNYLKHLSITGSSFDARSCGPLPSLHSLTIHEGALDTLIQLCESNSLQSLQALALPALDFKIGGLDRLEAALVPQILHQLVTLSLGLDLYAEIEDEWKQQISSQALVDVSLPELSSSSVFFDGIQHVRVVASEDYCTTDADILDRIEQFLVAIAPPFESSFHPIRSLYLDESLQMSINSSEATRIGLRRLTEACQRWGTELVFEEQLPEGDWSISEEFVVRMTRARL